MIKRASIAAIAIFVCQPAFAGAMAMKSGSPAAGTQSCEVVQYISPFLEAQAAAERAQYGMTAITPNSDVKFLVDASGAVYAGVYRDTYPGSRAYFLVGGERSQSDASDWARLSAGAVASIERGEVFEFTYTSWPQQAQINGRDAFSGFASARQNCLGYLNG